jgi:hypothetical protein
VAPRNYGQADSFLHTYLGRIAGSRDQQGLITVVPFMPPSQNVQPGNSETTLSFAGATGLEAADKLRCRR